MRGQIFIIFALLLGSEAFALEAKAPVLSLDDPYSIEWAGQDDVTELQIWARNKMESIDSSKDPVGWVKALSAYIQTIEEGALQIEAKGFLEKAFILIKDHPVPNEYQFNLKILQVELQVVEEFGLGAVIPTDHMDKILAKKIQIAEDLQLPAKKVFQKATYGQFLIETARPSLGIKTIHESIKDLSKMGDVSELDQANVKLIYASAIASFGSLDKSRLIYEELESFCAVKKIRAFCAQIDHAYSAVLLASKNIEDREASIKLLLRALATAEEIKNSSLVAYICNSLMRAYEIQGKFEEAKKYGLRAIEEFSALKDGVWLADTQMKMGGVLIKSNEPEESLKYSKIASDSFPSDYYGDHYVIAKNQAMAYKLLKQPAKAFEQLLYVVREKREKARRNQNADIAQYMTQINLELEEEQSRSLTEAENLQKVQDELNLTNRKEQQSTLFLINILWVFGSLLIASSIFGLIWISKQNKRILRLNKHLREDILQRFLPPVIAEKVASGQNLLDELPHEQQITPLFGRLVGLEHAIEDLGPRVAARLLESLMQAVTDVSLEYNGCLDKLHRGSFLILFGAPITLPVEEQLDHAIGFAQAILNRFNHISDNWPAVEGWRPGLAIGIHQGPALVGVFGGKRRADYTAIGQTVNVAARIEGEAKSGEIMVSEKVAQALSAKGQNCRSLGDVKLKGISKAQRLFIVDNIKEEKNAS